MRFSLILATYGRIKEVDTFLESLKNQNFKDFEIIIVDQNSNNEVYNLYIKYRDILKIKYVHIEQKGLSLARNIGLKYVKGDIVAFPDDDCEYPADLLKEVKDFFVSCNEYEIFTCKSIDKNLKVNSNGMWKSKQYRITLTNIFNSGISYTIFIKYKDIRDISFDERLGVGAEFGSSEETDMLLQLLHNKYRGYYNGQLYVYHPLSKNIDFQKEYKYALGNGALYKKELFIRGNHFYLFKYFKLLFRRLILLILYSLCLNTNMLNRTLLRLKGQVLGFLKYKC